MGVSGVAVFVVLVVVSLLVVVELGWFLRRRWRRRSGAETRSPAGSSPRCGALAEVLARVRVDEAEREESVLAAQLIGGHLSAALYRDRIAALAARDDVRRPMDPPPDGDT
jgi:hypothetical protein